MDDMYDVIGIGIGPFNLGLAALMDKTELNGIFFDKTSQFDWHPGMMIEKMDLQVPFLADVVTLADPTSPYSYLNYLREENRLFKFFFYSEFKVPRQEYNDYLKWVVSRLQGLMFNHKVIDVVDHPQANDPHYEVIVKDIEHGIEKSYHTRHVVMGTGSKPLMLKDMTGLPEEDVLHTSKYLYHKEKLLNSEHVTIVGSGQSAAEVFLDLLQEQEYRDDMHLTLLTRSAGLFQLESAKLGQEFFSPDYVDYFHELPFDKRTDSLEMLGSLRKGIDPDTLKGLYRTLYHKTTGSKKANITIQPMTEVQEITTAGQGYQLQCHQWQKDSHFTYMTDKVVLATGYRPHIPDWFLERFQDKVEWEDDKRYQVTRDFRLVFHDDRNHHFFVSTNLTHTHGAGATNLALATQRNIEIINKIAGKQIYEEQRNTIFQQFTMEDN
ncbi:lysine N(6)-hydroxylase/L-ornithine N(5)-oxygenase family protein [Thalassobacillus pellis]|uniref:lysine N(6)-hydroxylase/L-ornithine N(5)-oxygenase family protein n=1 Tax=Thalassobacillus pellis TaxID=748008 RepID=UPI001960865A|nr:SidA/IucD/PvdA family monooxygenase [Thalassobacillus pellis]MBM7552257.1 lysine N6-hydroxylase [Thalassobacillus pellis]